MSIIPSKTINQVPTDSALADSDYVVIGEGEVVKKVPISDFKDQVVEPYIISEAATRANADSTLQANISNEATTRASADTSILAEVRDATRVKRVTGEAALPSEGVGLETSYQASEEQGRIIAYDRDNEEFKKIAFNDGIVINELGNIDNIGRGLKKTSFYAKQIIGEDLPEDWLHDDAAVLASKTWSVNGAFVSPVGSTASIIYHNKPSALENAGVRINLVVTSNTCELVIFRKEGVPGPLGTQKTVYASVDVTNNKLKFYTKTWDYRIDNSPTVQKESLIPFALGTSRRYVVNLFKGINNNFTFSITDILTGDNHEMTASLYADQIGNGDGSIGFMAKSGTAGAILIERVEKYSSNPTAPQLVILGDSITEGDVLGADQDQKWALQLKRAVKGSAAIAGWGGDYTGGLLNRLDTDLNIFAPTYAIIEIGTNDGQTAGDEVNAIINLNTILNRVKKNGAIPVFCCVPPRNPSNPVREAINVWIRNTGEKYVSLDYALSVDNTANGTLDPAYDIGDGLHLNVAGNDRVFRQFQIEVPEIFAFATADDTITKRDISAAGPLSYDDETGVFTPDTATAGTGLMTKAQVSALLTGGTVDAYVNSLVANGNISGGDVRADRNNGTGVFFFGASTNYLMWDGSNFLFSGGPTMLHEMTTAARDAIVSPSKRGMIYNSTTNKYNFYNGTTWEELTSA